MIGSLSPQPIYEADILECVITEEVKHAGTGHLNSGYTQTRLYMRETNKCSLPNQLTIHPPSLSNLSPMTVTMTMTVKTFNVTKFYFK